MKTLMILLALALSGCASEPWTAADHALANRGQPGVWTYKLERDASADNGKDVLRRE